MQTQQWYWTPTLGWGEIGQHLSDADLVFVAADTPYFYGADCYSELRQRFPKAYILGCSSAGNVLGARLSDQDMAITAVKFTHSRVRLVAMDAGQSSDLHALSKNLLATLQEQDLRHIFILSDGQKVNGSDLVKGFWEQEITVSGGLAGDGTRFGATWVMANAPARNGCIAALGIYGDIQVRSTCFAGWHEFGTERIVTRSTGNIVMEIDGQPALTLYKKYLGEMAIDLPSSGLRFPLSVKLPNDDSKLVRTLLGIDEATQSLRFAGDVPEGAVCRLMRTQLDDLVDSAADAAKASLDGSDNPGLCLLVSCVGRRLVLGQMAEEELEAVQTILGPNMSITGFYSYGELAPHGALMNCQLHNQTMTITTLRE
ncbi:MAG: hypothetical protein RL571_1937 [Pseudomonadota bacterium]